MCHLTYIYSMMLCKNKKEWVYMAAYSIPMVTCHACKLKKKDMPCIQVGSPLMQTADRLARLVVLAPGGVTPYGKAVRR
jgi:hypothetical protein